MRIRSPGSTTWCTSGSGSASSPSRAKPAGSNGFLRTKLELTADNLSQHLGVLESAGLLEARKGYAGKRTRTRITLTTAGATALAAEIARLKQLIARVETS